VGATAVSAARDEILGRVRAATAGSAREVAVPRDYGHPTDPDPVEQFAVRVAEYHATVHRDAELEDVIAGLGVRRLGVPPGLHERPAGVELVEDEDLSPAALDALDGVLTGCALAVAETGTIVLDGGPRSGRRALTLVPDLHVCVVQADQVVPTVVEAIAALRATTREGRPITFVSGPSATSDIELSRVEGVHGPRRLEVVLVGQQHP